jgi:hypothetical protein
MIDVAVSQRFETLCGYGINAPALKLLSNGSLHVLVKVKLDFTHE